MILNNNKLPPIGLTGTRAPWREKSIPNEYHLIKNKDLKDHHDIQYKIPLGYFFNELYPGWNDIFYAVTNGRHNEYITREMFDKEKDNLVNAESKKKVRQDAAKNIINTKNEIYRYLTNHELNDYARHKKFVCANKGEDVVKNMADEVVDTVLSKINNLTENS